MKIKEWAQGVIRTSRKVLLNVFLWLFYFLGIGLTALWASVFNREFLADAPEGGDTFWREARGYGRGDHDVTRQS